MQRGSVALKEFPGDLHPPRNVPNLQKYWEPDLQTMKLKTQVRSSAPLPGNKEPKPVQQGHLELTYGSPSRASATRTPER